MTARSPLILAQEYLLLAEEAFKRFGNSAKAKKCRAIRLAVRQLMKAERDKFGVEEKSAA